MSPSPATERNVTISPMCNLRCHGACVFVRSRIGPQHPSPPFPLCSNKHHDKLPTPLTFSFLLFLTLLFPSGVRGTNNAGGFRCETCWWRRCRGSHDTRCCCGILRRGARRRMRSGACRLLQSKWTHLYVSYMTPLKAYCIKIMHHSN